MKYKKIPLKKRIEAYKLPEKLKKNGISRHETIKKINELYGIPCGTIYGWYKYEYSPYGKRKLVHRKELFYVIGALLGDGCIYLWRDKHQTLINGEREFIDKYAKKLSLCIDREVRYFFERWRYKKHGTKIWVSKVENVHLYLLIKKIKQDIDELYKKIKVHTYEENALEFLEGFFDAEGCVKIIKEEVRKTPKICLDITNTKFEFLELYRILLKDILNIEARYSIQKPIYARNKKTAYHLRIYKKEYIRRFFENINTTKLKPEKVKYVENWLNNGK